MNMRPIVTISTMPIRNRGYFEWLYTGLQLLEQQGKIELRHEGSGLDLFLRRHPRLWGKFDQSFPQASMMLFPVDHFAMAGRVEMGGRSMRFAYDVTDSPFTYALAHLERSDLYFKTQCPVSFEAEGYPLSSTVRVPYHPEVLLLQERIRPAMSTGAITSTLDLKRNLKVLETNRSIPAEKKRLRIFASFGGDRGPPSWKENDSFPAPHNYHNERTIVTRYGEAIQHPNEKRAELVRILRRWGVPDVDGRIWSSKDPEIQGDALEWNVYLKTVAASVFNINVSGFRRSLPFRFLDSFQVGCGIATDTIGTRWYQPFDSDLEVVEIGDLGYEAKDSIDWTVVENRLRKIYDAIDLDRNRSDEIRQLFATKWHPRCLATYFVQQCSDLL
jgi:hypothetical protein